MSENPVFNINFVKAIEKRPCIWNYSLTEYSKRNVTEKAWVEVAKEMNDSVSNCRERWRNIRGAFLRSMKKLPSGSGAKKQKKYYLNESLEFLLPYIKNKAGDGNLQTVSACNESADEGNNGSEEHTDNEEENMESQADQGSQDTAIHGFANAPPDMTDQGSTQDSGIDKSIIVAKKAYTSTKRKFSQNASTVSNPADAAFIGWLKNKQDRDSSKENPNMSFLQSLLPDMIKMTDKQNRRFRQKVIGLMDDILEDADIRACHSSTSSSRASYVYCPTPSPYDSLQCPTSNPDVPRPAWSLRELQGNPSEYLNDFQGNEDIRYT